MKSRLDDRVRGYLRDHQVATLATHSNEDPWAAAVFYVNAGYTLYFLSSPTSRHCLNLAENPRVAVTIQEDYADWLEIKGIQIEGVASEISGEEERTARRLYGQKFPIVGIYRINYMPLIVQNQYEHPELEGCSIGAGDYFQVTNGKF